MHEHYIEDGNGDLSDVFYFCSDACHVEWCADTDQEYGGWNGCHEGNGELEFCDNCGVVISGGDCEHQTENVVVNRFPRKHNLYCGCGNLMQLGKGRAL